MTNLEKLIETLQKAPIENTACFIAHNRFDYSCRWCAFHKDGKCTELKKDYDGYSEVSYYICEEGIKKWLESEVSQDV